MKSNNVINRCRAYLHQQGITGRRYDRLRQELTNLYGVTSQAVHASVDIHEARFVFLQTYITLGEILTLAPNAPASSHS